MAAVQSDSYSWDVPLKSIADIAASSEATRTEATRDTRVDTMRGVPDETPAPTAQRGRWLASNLKLAAHLVSLQEALQTAVDAGDRTALPVWLRRLSGGLTSVRDSLYGVQRAADGACLSLETDSACARFVDAVYWWMSRLMWGLEEAVAERRHVSSSAEAKALDAAQFAALYGSSHLSTLFEPCRASSGPLAGAVAAVNDDVQWLVLQLEDFVEVLKGERGP